MHKRHDICITRRLKLQASEITLLICALLSLGVSSRSFAASAKDEALLDQASVAPVDKKSDSKSRNFYQVLDDVLADFEFDLKNGQVTGLKDLAIRNIATSENIPPSFKNHLELALSERILRQSRTRIVQCLPCKAKRTTMSGDQVVISSPESNPEQLSRIAKLNGISHFMDVAFSFQPTGMILSLNITDPDSGSVLWSRSYNSENSRAAAFRRGVDYTQTDDARKASEYAPTIQYRAMLYYLFERNISGYTGCLAAGFRMAERYDNRKKEVGFELDMMKDSSTIVGSDSSNTNLYGGMNLTLLFLHSWNLIGAEENYNQVRGNVFVGIGGTYASGFLGGLIRGGYEWRLAKHWAISGNLGYRPKATAFVGSQPVGTVSGVEFGVGVSALF